MWSISEERVLHDENFTLDYFTFTWKTRDWGFGKYKWGDTLQRGQWRRSYVIVSNFIYDPYVVCSMPKVCLLRVFVLLFCGI